MFQICNDCIHFFECEARGKSPNDFCDFDPPRYKPAPVIELDEEESDDLEALVNAVNKATHGKEKITLAQQSQGKNKE